MRHIKNIPLEGPTEKPILTDFSFKENEHPKPVVIFCHGYKGYKDWGAWNLMADYYARQNFFFVKFNFSHNGGTAKNPIDFPDLEAFANDNYTTQLSDLEAVISHITTHPRYKNEIDPEDINLIGHSRGGGIVLIKAVENKLVKRVVTLASVSDFASRFPTGKKLEKWKETGVYHIQNSRTHQQMPHYYQFYEDFIAHQDRLNIQRAVRKLQVPQLIIHAKDDTSVKPEEAQNLHLWNPKSKLVLLEQGGHTFGTKQPWEKDNLAAPLKEASDEAITFLNEG